MASIWKSQVEVASIEKNQRGDTIKVHECVSSTGNKFVDVRQYFTNAADEECPTRKGIAIPEKQVADVAQALVDWLAEHGVLINTNVRQ